MYLETGAPSGFSWRLKIGQIWGFFKTEDLKIQFLRIEDWRQHYFVIFYPTYLMFKNEDSKTEYLKAEDSKYAFTCWEPHFWGFKACQAQIRSQFLADSIPAFPSLCIHIHFLHKYWFWANLNFINLWTLTQEPIVLETSHFHRKCLTRILIAALWSNIIV